MIINTIQNKISNNFKNFLVNPMINKFYLYNIFSAALYYVPILVVYLQSTLKDTFLVGILLSIKTFSSLIFEIPTGYVADKFGRKISVIIGILLSTVSLSIFVVSQQFIILCIAQVLFGLSETFNTGAFTSLIYDNLSKQNESEKFDTALKNLSFISSLVLFSSFIIGSYVYKFNNKLPFLLSLISLIFSVIICFTIKEYKYTNNDDESNSILKQLIKEPPKVWNLLTFSSLINSIFYSSYIFFVPILLKKADIKESLYGIIFSAGVLIYGFGAKYSGIIKNKGNFLVIIAPISAMIIYISCSFINFFLMPIILLFLIRIIWGAYRVICDIEVNHQIENPAIRATAISVGSGIEGGFSTLLTLLFGFLVSKFDTNFTLIFSGLLFFLVGLIFSIVSKKLNSIVQEN